VATSREGWKTISQGGEVTARFDQWAGSQDERMIAFERTADAPQLDWVTVNQVASDVNNTLSKVASSCSDGKISGFPAGSTVDRSQTVSVGSHAPVFQEGTDGSGP
jgi:hypothetical protein